MAATTAGAFKAYIESLRLGLAVYRDGAPVNPEGVVRTSYPYAVVQEGIGIVDVLDGDMGDPDAEHDVTELVQIDLYQLAREQIDAQRTRVVEDYALPRKLRAALRGRGVAPYAPVHVYGHTVDSEQRWLVSDNIVRHTWTVRVRRAEDERQ